MSFVGPIAVAIVVYGEKTPQGRKFEELTSNGEVDAYGPIDVRAVLKFDPLLSKKREFKVKHTDNGDSITTQLSMFNDKRFFTAVKGITEMVQAYADQEGYTDASTFNVTETEQTHMGVVRNRACEVHCGTAPIGYGGDGVCEVGAEPNHLRWLQEVQCERIPFKRGPRLHADAQKRRGVAKEAVDVCRPRAKLRGARMQVQSSRGENLERHL